eukprot:COSAG05_NODE_2350_length_3195_cov_2.770995_5_plen_52_part_00
MIFSARTTPGRMWGAAAAVATRRLCGGTDGTGGPGDCERIAVLGKAVDLVE